MTLRIASYVASIGALSALVIGCSAETPVAARQTDPQTNTRPATGGSTADPNRGPTTAPTGDPGGVLPPARPATASNTAGAASPTMTPNTSISREPIAIDECGATNPAGLSAADADKLKAAAGAPGLRFLYPYDGTVFPRGMLAPDLMWDGDGGAAEAVYVHIKSQIFEYWGCLKPVSPGRVTVSQEVWDQAGQRSFGKGDNYTIDLAVIAGGTVTGPVTLRVEIAQAAIKGSIYYNTYRSNLLTGGMPTGGMAPPGIPGFPGGGFPGGGFPGGGASNGIVVRIPAGGKAEVFGQTDCNGCHSVSADGSLLLAQSAAGGPLSYQIASGAAPMATVAGQNNACWSALYPDGSTALTMSTVIDVARTGIFGGLTGATSTDATLFNTLTGEKIAGNGIPPGLLMPFFSPDGSLLVFNDFAVKEAHGIALTRYDTATHTASDYSVLYEEPAGAMRPAWPFVLPDNKGVVFVRTDEGDFTGGGVGVSGDIQPGQMAPFAELSIIDIASKQVTLLAKAMGYNTPEDAVSGTTYLPFGAEDLHHAYYPTVSPVGGGGYFWVFFDSVRHYGTTGLQRQLWGAAIDISADGTYTRDPSHPAFYLSGQEFGTGNHRAFAALDPCRMDGDRCTSGVDCCGGHCYLDPIELVEPTGTCSPRMTTCSMIGDGCTVAGDCCPPADPNELPRMCIAGFCTQVRGPD